MPDNSSPKSPSDRLRQAIPLAIFLIALGLRLIGLSWGLKNDLHNQSYHPDEPVVFGYSRQIEPAQGQFVPHFYSYGTLYLTLLRVSSDLVSTYTGGPKEGLGWSWSNPDKTDWDWVARCNMGGRVISAYAGAGTCLVVFLMLRRFLGVLGAGAAGLALAVAPAHVVHSRFQTVDILATFLIALSAHFAFKLLPASADDEALADKVALKFAILSGVFAGLSMGTKYTGVLALLTLAVVLVIARRKTWVKELLAAGLVTLAVFVVTTPGFVLDSAKFWQDFNFEREHMATGNGLSFAGTPTGFLFHLSNLSIGLGPLLALIGVAGLAFATYKKQIWAVALLAFFVPYYLLISKAEVKFLRYTFPLYVGIAAGFGYAVAEGQKKKGVGQAVVGLSILGLGGIPFGGLRSAVTMTSWMVEQDPREAALAALRADAPASLGMPKDPWFWSVPTFPNSGAPRRVPYQLLLQQMATLSNPPVVFASQPNGRFPNYDIRLIESIKPDEIVTTSLDFPEHLIGAKDLGLAQPEVNDLTAFGEALKRDYSPTKSFGTVGAYVEDLEYVQPVVTIWKRKNPR